MIRTPFEAAQDDIRALLDASPSVRLGGGEWETTSGGAGFLGASLRFTTPKGDYTVSITKVHALGETQIAVSFLKGSVDRADTLTTAANFVQPLSADPAQRASEMARIRNRLSGRMGVVFGPEEAQSPPESRLGGLWRRMFG
ncbi:hypothetical protein [Zavarzinia sp. CC-PAN008]|uniref:hypothetical protein n=1 Tax=Zavarzinia sp. CC-PAN008 TaxID=3243332 RepID=UPI003F7481B5